MAEEEQVFDPSLMKKKKKKTKLFDLDAAMAGGETAVSAAAADRNGQDNPTEKENVEPNGEKGLEDASLLDLDLESFGKKKKKKKGKEAKEVDIEDLTEKDEVEEETEEMSTDFGNLKKKKKKKKALDELVLEGQDGEEGAGEGQEGADAETGAPLKHAWLATDRDYTYDELLTRVFDIMLKKNPEMAAGTKQKFVMRPPQVVRVGTKKTSFVNFMEICKMLHRHQKHLLDFLLSELGTSGSIDGNNQLIIKGRFQQKQIENVLRRYIKEYVTCHTCRSANTLLQKDSRLFFLQCEVCGSRCSVASIKHGFQAVTGKRAAMRAKAT